MVCTGLRFFVVLGCGTVQSQRFMQSGCGFRRVQFD